MASIKQHAIGARLVVSLLLCAAMQASAARLWLPGFEATAGSRQQLRDLQQQQELHAVQLRRLLEGIDAQVQPRQQVAATHQAQPTYGDSLGYGYGSTVGTYGDANGPLSSARRNLLAPELQYASTAERVERVLAAGSAWQPSAGSIVLSGRAGVAAGVVQDSTEEPLVLPVPAVGGF